MSLFMSCHCVDESQSVSKNTFSLSVMFIFSAIGQVYPVLNRILELFKWYKIENSKNKLNLVDKISKKFKI